MKIVACTRCYKNIRGPAGYFSTSTIKKQPFQVKGWMNKEINLKMKMKIKSRAILADAGPDVDSLDFQKTYDRISLQREIEIAILIAPIIA